ncbi:MAG: ABC transporter ATP-binding protein [Alphaproteobacteria bacterium]|nr:ABC transporter ATP-binding protein [Alphaproteobacteria bacterium]
MDKAKTANNNKTHAIDILSVTKIYPHRTHPVTALNDISFAIEDNEFFTLLGPSGCGKTTLLRMIGGFEGITKGQIQLYGEDISTLQPNQRPINTVFQQYALFPHLTVFENVAFGLKRLGRDRAFIQKQTEAMLELIRMADFAHRKPNQLSGGQQQRVALARALAPQPKVLLLDEPLSALDLKLRQAMREELKDIQKKTGITFIFVTHDQEEALTMSDRIAVMSNGEVQQIGTATDIYDHPINHFVATFIGEANILSASVTKINKNSIMATLAAGGGSVEVATDLAMTKGQKISLMIRPERVKIGKASRAKSALSGVVQSISYLGTDTQLHVSLNARQETELNTGQSNGEIIIARQQNHGDGGSPFHKGDAVSVTIAENALRILQD